MTQSEPTASELARVVAEVRLGSPTALGAMYRWYAPDLLRLATRLLASRADAEDVVHDLFVGLPEHLVRYDERGHCRAWLRATTIGMVRMRVRKEARRADVLARDVTAHASTVSPDFAARLDLEHAVHALPESLRLVFVLKQWEGYSHDEIATLLNISAWAARVRHSRALDTLRTQLDR
jgi:RNA polymerase sigma-70 factor, ECF subfamily